MDPHGVPLRILRALPTIILFLLLTSCAADDSGPGTSTGPEDPLQFPLLPLPRLAFEPHFASADSVARQAASLVAGQRNMIPYVGRSCDAAVSMFNGGMWNPEGGSCWSKRQGADPGEGCSYTFRACVEGGRFEWTEVIDGLCPDGFNMTAFHNWVRMRALTSADAREGSFRIFRSATDVVDRAWTWSRTDEPAGGEWVFYLGQIDETDPMARLRWTRPGDTLETAEWSWPGYARWESRIASDGLTGFVTAHEWVRDSRSWRRAHEIRWADGHGAWTTFDSTGAVATERSW